MAGSGGSGHSKALVLGSPKASCAWSLMSWQTESSASWPIVAGSVPEKREP